MPPEIHPGDSQKKDSWWLEVSLAIILGLPWLFLTAGTNWKLIFWLASASLYSFLVLVLFGRGSAISAFLVVLILATLIVLVQKIL